MMEDQICNLHHMIRTDMFSRCTRLPANVRLTNSELRHAHSLVCRELEEIWQISFAPFFYPADDGINGGWLDLDDMLLTLQMLLRYLAELCGLSRGLALLLPLHEHLTRTAFNSFEVSYSCKC